MKRRPEGPGALEPLRGGAETSEDPMAALLLKVGDPQPLGPVELARVKARLRQRGEPGRRTRANQLGSVLVALLTGVGVASAGWGILEVTRPRASAVEGSPAKARPAPLRGSGAPAPRSAAPTAAASVTPPDPKPSSSVDVRRTRRAEAHVSDGAARYKEESRSTSAPNQLARESEVLARALVKLRRERDPSAALAALDDYAAEFPRGALFLEAQVARVDALLALGEKASVLTILSELPLDRVGRGAELRLIRAELTAEADCGRARADLDGLVDVAPANVRERALRARAACRLRLQDAPGAAADLRAYLAAYPNGRFAAEARMHLQTIEGTSSDVPQH